MFTLLTAEKNVFYFTVQILCLSSLVIETERHNFTQYD